MALASQVTNHQQWTGENGESKPPIYSNPRQPQHKRNSHDQAAGSRDGERRTEPTDNTKIDSFHRSPLPPQSPLVIGCAARTAGVLGSLLVILLAVTLSLELLTDFAFPEMPSTEHSSSARGLHLTSASAGKENGEPMRTLARGVFFTFSRYAIYCTCICVQE